MSMKKFLNYTSASLRQKDKLMRKFNFALSREARKLCVQANRKFIFGSDFRIAYNRLLKLITLLIAISLMPILCHADETKSDQLPQDYRTAQEIIAKKKVDGHKGAYYLLWNLDVAARRDDAQVSKASIDKPSGKRVPDATPEPGQDRPTSTTLPDHSPNDSPNDMMNGPEIPAIALAMLIIPPPPARDYSNEPGITFMADMSQTFIAWAMQPKKEGKK